MNLHHCIASLAQGIPTRATVEVTVQADVMGWELTWWVHRGKVTALA